MEGQTLTQIVVGIVLSYLLEWAKKASWFPWLTEQSGKYLKLAFSALVAAGSAFAISVAWDPAGVLTISGLTWANLWAGLQAFLVSFLAQHISYEKLVRGPSAASAAKIASVLLMLALVLPATGCALKGTPRHQTTVAAVAISDSLIAATDFEREHWRDLTMTEAQHKAYQGRMVQVLTTAREVDKTILLWPRGAAAPEGLRPLVLQLKADLDLALQLLPPSATKDKVTTQLAAVWSLVGLVLGS